MTLAELLPTVQQLSALARRTPAPLPRGPGTAILVMQLLRCCSNLMLDRKKPILVRVYHTRVTTHPFGKPK